jgi:uncharacterized protein
LSFAALNGNLNVVQELIKAGAGVNFNPTGFTALISAAEESHINVALALITAGADVNIQNEFRSSALMWSAQRGDTLIVDAIIKTKRAKLNLQNRSGKTGLIFAAEYGCKEIVKMLLKADADKTIPANDGNTPLMLAFRYGHPDIGEILKECRLSDCYSGTSSSNQFR